MNRNTRHAKRWPGEGRTIKRVLVAEVQEADERLSAILAGNRLTFVRTLDRAKLALAEADFDLLVIGAHFDNSGIFELLRHARANGRNRQVPILCVRVRPGFSAISSKALEVTVKALNASAFVDLANHADTEEGHLAVRRIVEGLFQG